MSKTLEMNKLVERMNRIIMERIQSMLARAKLSKTFWVEAMMTITYVINRSPQHPFMGISAKIVDRQRRVVLAFEGVRLSYLCACHQG